MGPLWQSRHEFLFVVSSCALAPGTVRCLLQRHSVYESPVGLAGRHRAKAVLLSFRVITMPGQLKVDAQTLSRVKAD